MKVGKSQSTLLVPPPGVGDLRGRCRPPLLSREVDGGGRVMVRNDDTDGRRGGAVAAPAINDERGRDGRRRQIRGRENKGE